MKAVGLIDDERLPESPKSLVDDAEDIGDELSQMRRRFVGEVDLPESEEPLLKDSKRRFVLFPIQYHEVRP